MAEHHDDEFCTAIVFLGDAMLTCDRYFGHDGRHGGVYPGEVDGKTVDVQAQWSDK